MDTPHLVRFKLDDDSFIDVEVASQSGRGRRSGSDGQPEEATQRFEEVMKKLKPVTETIFNSLKELNTPDEINLKMGIKLSADAGIVLASAGSEATLKVSLKWKNS